MRRPYATDVPPVSSLERHIVTAGPNPVASRIHVLPPSIDTITPRSVPRL